MFCQQPPLQIIQPDLASIKARKYLPGERDFVGGGIGKHPHHARPQLLLHPHRVAQPQQPDDGLDGLPVEEKEAYWQEAKG